MLESPVLVLEGGLDLPLLMLEFRGSATSDESGVASILEGDLLVSPLKLGSNVSHSPISLISGVLSWALGKCLVVIVNPDGSD